MTRKDYEAIAATIRRARQANSESTGHQIAISDVAILLAGTLAADNPNFDRERFIAACQS